MWLFTNKNLIYVIIKLMGFCYNKLIINIMDL